MARDTKQYYMTIETPDLIVFDGKISKAVFKERLNYFIERVGFVVNSDKLEIGSAIYYIFFTDDNNLKITLSIL